MAFFNFILIFLQEYISRLRAFLRTNNSTFFQLIHNSRRTRESYSKFPLKEGSRGFSGFRNNLNSLFNEIIIISISSCKERFSCFHLAFEHIHNILIIDVFFRQSSHIFIFERLYNSFNFFGTYIRSLNSNRMFRIRINI